MGQVIELLKTRRKKLGAREKEYKQVEGSLQSSHERLKILFEN